MDDSNFTRTAALVRRAQVGDATAADALFERYYRRIHPHVRARLGPALRREFESVDIVQDAFTIALRRLGDFELRDEASFLRWMRRIVEWQITDKARRLGAKRRDRAREVRLPDPDESNEAGVEPESPRTGPFDAMIKVERTARIAAQLEGLPEHYRRVVLMRIHEGLSWDEIALQLGDRSPDAARMLFSKALKLLVRRVRPQNAS